MRRRASSRYRFAALVPASLVLCAADQTTLGPTVGNVLITKPIPGGNLGLSNRAAVKTIPALDLRVSGDEPVYQVTGQLFCKNGARLVEAQAIIGNLVLHGADPVALAPYGKSAKLRTIAGRQDADVTIPVRLSVARRDTGQAIDLSFNPARRMVEKAKAFAANGGSMTAYLQQDEAFDMPVDVNLIAWCRMPSGANSVLAGKTYAGFATRSVPVTILYSGDPKLVDGPGVRGSIGQQVAPPVQPTPDRRRN